MPRSFPDKDKSPRRRPAPGRLQDDDDDDDDFSSRGNRGKASPLDKLNSYIEEKRQDARVEPIKIEAGRRTIALGIDFAAAYLLFIVISVIPFFNRFFTMPVVLPLFMCMRDFLYGGRGIGKNFMGFAVVDMRTGGPPNLIQVLTRNLVYLGPLIALQAFDSIFNFIPPSIGSGTQAFQLRQILEPFKEVFHLILSLYVLVIVPIETYRTYARDDSMRLGDALAGTCLLDSDTNFKEILPK